MSAESSKASPDASPDATLHMMNPRPIADLCGLRVNHPQMTMLKCQARTPDGFPSLRQGNIIPTPSLRSSRMQTAPCRRLGALPNWHRTARCQSHQPAEHRLCRVLRAEHQLHGMSPRSGAEKQLCRVLPRVGACTTASFLPKASPQRSHGRRTSDLGWRCVSFGGHMTSCSGIPLRMRHHPLVHQQRIHHPTRRQPPRKQPRLTQWSAQQRIQTRG